MPDDQPARLPAPPELDRDATTPAHVAIEAWLTDAVASGTLVTGDRLPGERHLAAYVGVSRMTLRQALATLEARGLLVRTPGRGGGAFVAEPRIDLDLTGLSGFTAQLRRANVRAGARLVSATTVPAGREVASALGLALGEKVHEVVRVRSARREPVALERSWFPADRLPGFLDQRLSGSLYALLRTRYDLEPASADEALDATSADETTAAALAVAVGTPLLRVQRTAATAEGLPVEHARDLFRADRVRVRVRSGVR